jgi:acetyl-CoA acetyltransferase
VLRELGLKDDATAGKPNDGVIALGYLLSASGARLASMAVNQQYKTKSCFALCTVCISVEPGIAVILVRM